MSLKESKLTGFWDECCCMDQLNPRNKIGTIFGWTDRSLTFPSGSGILNNAARRDDLPDPVRPDTPIFSPSPIVSVTSLRIRRPPSKYVRDRSLIDRSPLVGHDTGGWALAVKPGSGISCVYVITLSTDVMRVSVSDTCWSPNWAASKVSSV